jgi:hypothetical protein
VVIARYRAVSFRDVPFLQLRAGAPISALPAATTTDAELMWRIVTDLLRAFLGETLDAPTRPTFYQVAGRYPAIIVGAP